MLYDAGVAGVIETVMHGLMRVSVGCNNLAATDVRATMHAHGCIGVCTPLLLCCGVVFLRDQLGDVNPSLNDGTVATVASHGCGCPAVARGCEPLAIVAGLQLPCHGCTCVGEVA